MFEKMDCTVEADETFMAARKRTSTKTRSFDKDAALSEKQSFKVLLSTVKKVVNPERLQRSSRAPTQPR